MLGFYSRLVFDEDNQFPAYFKGYVVVHVHDLNLLLTLKILAPKKYFLLYGRVLAVLLY
jgi:hypothetical protein